MEENEMLSEMCRKALTNADLKAIAKRRGFSAKEIASRSVFENFYLNDLGVAEVLDSLLDAELALLHLLRYADVAIDVACLAPAYGGARGRPYDSFSARYREVFNEARKALVRGGILLMCEDANTWSSATKLERWRFRLPKAFAGLLPRPVRQPSHFGRPEEPRTAPARGKLLELTGARPSSPARPAEAHQLKLVDGEIQMGDGPLTVKRLRKWQQECWAASVRVAARELRLGSWIQKKISAVDTATYLLGEQGPDEFAAADQLTEYFRVFLDRDVDVTELCEAGVEWGCLEKRDRDGQAFYRLAEEEPTADAPPGTYLAEATRDSFTVDLRTVPLPALELLNRVAHFEGADQDGPRLLARPSVLKIGRAWGEVRGRPLATWLRDNLPAFGEAVETVEARMGKLALHENLLIARVTDLSLKVEIERAFGKSIVSLAEEAIAFPQNLLARIESLVTKSGHVIRTEEAGDA